MEDVYASREFRSLHTLQRRVGERPTERHPYEAVIRGLSSLRAEPCRHGIFRRRVRDARG
jgi:hypothetical protein